MNIAQCEDKIVKLINDYSVSGNITPITDANRLDYSLRFRVFMDTAQKEIATIKKIPDDTSIQEADVTITDAPYIVIDLPTNYYQMQSVEYNFDKIHWIPRGKSKIAVKNDAEFPIDIFYFAKPTTIDDSTLSTYEFEIDEDAQEAIPYYVAAHVLMDEQGKSNVSARYLAMYNNKLSNLDTKMSNGSNTVVNTLFSSSNSTKLF